MSSIYKFVKQLWMNRKKDDEEIYLQLVMHGILGFVLP